MHSANMKTLEKLFTLPTEHEVKWSAVQSGLFRNQKKCLPVSGNKLRTASSSPQPHRCTADCDVSAYLTQTYLTHVGHYFI